MGIREQGYHKWDGQLRASRFAWLPIFWVGIKMAFRKKYSKALFMATNAPFLAFLGGVYVSTRPELKMFPRIVELLKIDARFFSVFYTNGFLIFMLMMLCLVLFVDLICGDLKSNSFPLYFSRPLDRMDYILGKFSIILFYLLLFTLVPGLLLMIFKFIFTGAISLDPRLLLGILVVPILVSIFFASMTLMVSSLTSNGRYVRIIILLVFIFSNSIAQVLKSIFRSPYCELFSVARNIEQMGAYVFNTQPVFSAPKFLSLAIILGLSVLSIFILYKKIGKSEAQIEIGS